MPLPTAGSVWTALLALACSRAVPAPARPPTGPAIGWLKGQLHLHSGNSGDSRTPPTAVVDWYARRGYDFMVFTDHNRVTRVRSPGPMLVFAGVELTSNPSRCDPPAEDGGQCNLHLNALFVRADAPFVVDWPMPPGLPRLEYYRRALAVARSLGALVQLDHPNFRWAADGPTVVEMARRGVQLLEVANESGDNHNEGDRSHPSTETLWDEALTAGRRVWGVATDDAHHYDDAEAVRARGETAFTGDRGWVMVHARREEGAIRRALAGGDFYASNGVQLERLEVTGGTLRLAVAGTAADGCETAFVGTGGRVLARVRGCEAACALSTIAGGYVRAVVTDPAGRRAWVQPVRVP